jgi:lathosterol oxidase
MGKWLLCVAASTGIGWLMYFSLGGVMWSRWYVRRRDQAAAWKCQPDRWLTADQVRHAIKLGVLNLALGGLLSGTLAWHIFVRHGWTTLYFDLRWHSLPVAIAIFLVTDLAAYGAHRLLHRKALFLAIHKWHHKYNAPVPFTVTAMHPAEFLFYQTIFLAPPFLVPMPAIAYYGLLVYIFYFNTVDHSGIVHRSWLPWQGPSKFHDDHHKFFHCNFGQSMMLWDRLLGTLRRQGRRYGETVYGGKGADCAGRRPDEAVGGPRNEMGDGAGAEFVDYAS